ncbi:hypothetical protein [Streptosporangium sp. NPDC051022]|uniref:hypothetical protein n=1 Tax=Streptosporangium sp. NPDC051022 TaxID=3155752 RepID=UPI0034484C60
MPLLPDGWTPAGLVISVAAALVATVALARLAEFEGPRGAGPYAVAALLLSPASVFLFVGRTEALFLAFALPAWLAARRGNWPAAALLAAAASCVRFTGLLLALALVVEFLTSGRAVRQAAWLAVPFVPTVLLSVYHRVHDGRWLAWQDAREAGWGPSPVWPWESLAATWQGALGDGRFVWMFRLELAGAVAGIGLVVVLFHLRRWSELVYVGLQVGALVCSASYLAIPRAAVLWWPLFLLVGRASAPGAADRTGATDTPGRARRGARPGWWPIVVYALALGPLMVLNTMTFVDSAWAG